METPAENWFWPTDVEVIALAPGETMETVAAEVTASGGGAYVLMEQPFSTPEQWAANGGYAEAVKAAWAAALVYADEAHLDPNAQASPSFIAWAKANWRKL